MFVLHVVLHDFSKNVTVASSPYRIEAGEAKEIVEKVREVAIELDYYISCLEE